LNFFNHAVGKADGISFTGGIATQIIDDDTRSARCQNSAERASQPATGAGDNRNLSGQIYFFYDAASRLYNSNFMASFGTDLKL